MRIGIDASRAFLSKRTGIEEYSYQVVKNLRDKLNGHDVFLYVRKNQAIDFELPDDWQVKIIKLPRFWTQIGLSWEMLWHPVDVLFVPAHTVPWIHPASTAGGPQKTVVTVHGLEYEFCPEAYSFWEQWYMRLSIKNSCRWAKWIIAVSENTKRDLVQVYQMSEEKIVVIGEGYEDKLITNNSQPITKIQNPETKKSYQLSVGSYLLFVGRIEERKNIRNIIEAFEILKEKYQLPQKLVLAGKPGYGYEKVQDAKRKTQSAKDIMELGFVSEQEKWMLLKNAAVFVFPSLYEGFGLPILEAQSVGCPVVAANTSSLPEVAGASALLVDPKNPQEIAEAIYKLLSDEKLRNAIIEKGQENLKRFSWEKCSDEIAKILWRN